MLKGQDRKDRSDHVSHYAAFLSLVEIGLGSVVHGFRIPFGGQLMSINQGAVLSHATRLLPNNTSSSLMMISSIVAVMKSLSPAGNKLGPMLSISMQGNLFALGTAVLGPNLFGVVLGMGLLSLWAFIQPFLTAYLFFGNGLFDAIEFYSDKMQSSFGLTPENLLVGLFVIVLFKVVLAAAVGSFVFLRPSKADIYFDKFSFKGKLLAQRQNEGRDPNFFEVLKLSLRDLLRPFFLISFVLMVVFFLFSRSQWSEAIWLSLRPLAIAFLFFFISRSPYFYRWTSRLRKFSFFAPFFAAVDKTYQRMIELQHDAPAATTDNR